MPLVSVIIPVRDAGRYLHPCLCSVRRQTHTDLQIICVDDGSSDQSAAVLARHADDDLRVQVISQARAGPGGARNAGLVHAVGDFLLFVDADDLLPPEAVEIHLNALRSSRSDFSTGRVLRRSGSYRWPSAQHDSGPTRPAPGTHLFGEPGLLFDTTSWNKLFRRDYWAAHRYAFPERVVFEDVALMIEAHCRASAVEVLADVVYEWRRRDDGTASITMRRSDPDVLRDRVDSLRRVRRVLGELAPPSVRRAAEVKFLRHDLGSYLRDLEDMEPEFQAAFVRITAGFVESSPAEVVDRLPPHFRVAYRLLGLGEPRDLVAYLAFLRENDWRLPLRRRGPALRADLGPARTILPRRYGSALRRMPLRSGVDGLSWRENSLVIEGHGFIDGVAMNHPAAALRRLQLIDPPTQRKRSVWITPRRLPDLAPRARTDGAYTWSGFQAEIPFRLLDPGPTRDRARWQVNLQVLTLGAGSGSALAPPLGPDFTEVGRGPLGLVVRVDWSAGRRMVIEAVRAAAALTAVDDVDGLLELTFQLTRAPGSRRPHAARLATATGSAIEVPLTPSSLGTGRVRATVDPVVLHALRGARPPLTLGLTLVTADGVATVVNDLRHDVAVPVSGDTVVIAGDGRGGVEIVVTAPRTVVTGTSWIGATLEVHGVCPENSLPRLAWCDGAGGVLEGVLRSTGDGFQSVFEPLEVPGPDGVHPLAAGTWTLMQRQDDGSWEPAATSFGRPAASRNPPPGEGLDGLRIGLDARRSLVMSVVSLPAGARGRLGQERLQRGTYRRARRQPLTDTILLQSWGGKRFSDNPRGLVEALPAEWEAATVVVAVSDRSLRVPARFRTVIAGSRDHYDQLARARLIISNDAVLGGYVKRPGQRYLQTWHGTPLKRIGLDIRRIQFRNKNYRHQLRTESASWDWLVAQNAYSAEIFRRAFAYEGPILEHGYPRNDLLADLPRRAARRAATRRWLNIGPEETAVLWAPTWRDDTHAAGGGYGSSLLVERAEIVASLPDDTVLLLHGHHLAGAAQTHLGHDGVLRDVSGYPDLRDLIAASDALVTDYSSIMFDYALTGLPIICFVPDLAHYSQIRGLYLDLVASAPGPVLSSVDELADALRSLPAIKVAHRDALRGFGERFCALDDGQAARRVWAAVRETSPI